MTAGPDTAGGVPALLTDAAADAGTGAGAGHEPVDRSALMHNYGEPTVTFVRGEGSRLYDETGREYLDFLSGLAVTSLGHAHPAVADAVAHQARTLVHVSNLFGTTLGPEVAATLDRLIGGGVVPQEDGWNGWLGRYQKALVDAAFALEQRQAKERERRKARDVGR